MEIARLFLLSVLFLVALLLWNAWGNDYPKVLVSKTQQQSQQATSVPPQTIPTPPTTVVKTSAIANVDIPTVTAAKTKGFVQVQTDVLSVVIDTHGGNIIRTNLLKYPQTLDKDAPPYPMFSDDPASYYVAQSGLISDAGPDTHQQQANYTATQPSYVLAPNQKQIVVTLNWQNPQGLVIKKRFVFKRNDYQVNVEYQIENKTKASWAGQVYAQLQRKKVTPPSHMLFGINAFTGAAISSADKPYQKLSFSKLSDGNINTQIQGGWLAMQEHYFLSAWIPPASQTFQYYSQVAANNDIYTVGMIGPTLQVSPGNTLITGTKLYVGPEIMDLLKAAAPNLDLTIDYGILWFISIAILWLMKQIYSVVGNWGSSIVLVTVLIKLAFYHLSAKSYRSMAIMRKLQPRIQALKERYADDRQKMTQATMELYKTEKINPLGGCLPVLVQVPVFIALYFVLIESVELRQAPFILWIHDLSVKDPYFVMPILMGLTMYIQQRLNPPPADPTQAKVMQFLPVFFTFLFLSFPAGLVLYWLVNNSISILQQWYIMRKVEQQNTSKKPPHKKKK